MVPSVDVEALENELDDAHREIARLKAVMQQSPARKVMDTVKDNRIQMLEREQEDLLQRVQVLKDTVNGTPSKAMNDVTVANAVSPFHRQMVSMLSPKTPGAPLRDVSDTLHSPLIDLQKLKNRIQASRLNATMNDPTSPFFSEVARLRQELERANQSIDEKLERIKEAGMDVVSLTRQVEDGHARIAALEDEADRLSRRDDRRTHRLQKMRCGKCCTKIDARNIDADERYMRINGSMSVSNLR